MTDELILSRFTRREALRLFGAAAGLGVLAACTPGSTPSPQTAPKPPAGPSGTLTSAIAAFGDDTLEPINFLAVQLTDPMFENLVTFDAKGKLVPNLLESWSLREDGKTWDLKVRKGVKFHNGDELTSADVKFSFERLLAPKSRHSWTTTFRAVIAGVEAPDPSTVLVTTKDVDVNFIYSTMGAVVVPKKYIEEKGEEYIAKNPVGTGPWKLLKHEPGQYIEYEAVKDHWRIVPAFEKLHIKMVPEEGTRMAMLKRGEIDVMEITLNRIDEVKAAGFETRNGFYEAKPEIVIIGTYLNTDQPTMDVRIRKALSLAINREEIAKSFFGGNAEPGVMRFMSSGSWGWDPSWKADPYDPKKARELLAEAEYPAKFKDPVVNLWSAPSASAAWLPDWVQVVSGYWEAVGIKTKITPIEAATLRGMYTQKPPDPRTVGTCVSSALTTFPFSLYHNFNGYRSTGGSALLKDPEIDAAGTRINGERDENKRMQLFREFMVKTHDLYVDLQTVNVKQVYAVSKKVGEFRAVATTLSRMYEGIQQK